MASINSEIVLENLFNSQVLVIDESSLSESYWVIEAKRNLHHLLDFPTLVIEFSKLKQNLYIASNSAVVAREKFGSVYVQIQNLSTEMARQCRNSVALMNEFEMTCKEAILNLQFIFISLKDNQDKIAAVRLKTLSESISLMEEQSMTLSKDFDSLSQKVAEVLRNVAILEDVHNLATEKINAQMELLKKKMATACQSFHESVLEEKKAAEKKISTETEAKGTMFTDIVAGFQEMSCSLKNLSCHSVFRNEANPPYNHSLVQSEAALKKYKETHKQSLKAMDEWENTKFKASQLEKIEDEVERAKMILHNSTVNLKRLSCCMLKTAGFWNFLKNCCNRVAGITEQESVTVEIVSETTPDERLKILSSDSIQRNFLHILAVWCHLLKVCAESKKELQITEKAIYKAIEENPTPEQAGENMIREIRNY